MRSDRFLFCVLTRSWSSCPRDQVAKISGLLGHVAGIFLAATLLCPPALAQGPAAPPLNSQPQPQEQTNSYAESELQRGIALTRKSHFQEAISHFLAARGRVSDEYAVDFNLALCYVATNKFHPAIEILTGLTSGRTVNAGVYNLLAQAYIGTGRSQKAFQAFQAAAKLTPKSEKLYLFVADACMDQHSYKLGLKVLNAGLKELPQSATLHYERGIFYSFVDQPDLAGNDLQEVAKLAPGKMISYLAAAQKALLDGDIPGTIREARKGIQKDPNNFFLLAILGQALIKNGVRPGQPEFTEAQNALEKSVAERPDYWVSQLALGTVDQMGGNLNEAISHLEIARKLSPANPAPYAQLAIVYRKRGDMADAEKTLRILAGLNQKQAARYKLAEPGHMASYLGSQGP